MPKSVHDQFCANVKARRLELELTQQDVADRLDVTQAYIAEIEAGRHTPTLDLVERLARALKTTASELIKSSEKVSKPY